MSSSLTPDAPGCPLRLFDTFIDLHLFTSSRKVASWRSAAKRNIVAVEISSANGINAALLNRVFSAFDEHACAVAVMGTSLGRVSLLVGSSAALPRIAADLQGIAQVRWEKQHALVCLIGENLRRQAEVASRAFAAVSDVDIRVQCQGASDRTISFLVEESKVEESVQRLHRAFFPKTESVGDWGGFASAFCQAGSSSIARFRHSCLRRVRCRFDDV